MLEPDEFRDVMARFPSGVTVVTTASPDGYHGVTVSAFCSLSLEPPLVLVCIDKAIQSHDLITNASAFVVNLLARDQSFLAEQFAGRTPLADPSFSRLPHRLGELGAPVLDGTVGHVECERWAAYDGGDHTIVVGQAHGLALGPASDPLVYFERGFTDLAW
ncbi:MAG TPA: flavin reductase family protein [Thermomicrobiaceae bacterium]|nr:flavin reductase family protein [Thermomicrobiaceae bacterium]